MIKNKKSGFSLAEILLALGIISIIATMGFSMSKKSIEKSYNQYYYTGYVGIQSAITGANNKGYTVGSSDFYKYIAETLFRGSYNASTGVINTPSNINYTIKKDTNNNLYIQMSLPGVNGRKTVDLYYLPDEYDFVLVGDQHANRIDLLPFFIDDGIAGRVRQRLTNSGNSYSYSSPIYEKRKYYSFNNAFCKVYPGNSPSYNSSTILTCSGTVGSGDGGAIKIANPQKVF